MAAFMVLCVPPRELTEDKPRTRCWSAFVGYPQLVTHLYVHAAEGLENQDNPGGQGSFWRTSLSQCMHWELDQCFPAFGGGPHTCRLLTYYKH